MANFILELSNIKVARINQKKLKKLLTEEMKFSILNKLLFEAANISKGFEKSSKNFLTKR